MLLLQVSLFLEIRSSKVISDSARQARDALNLYNCDSWRQPPLPHKFAASHGSARRRETRQRRSSALANAVCVTARALRGLHAYIVGSQAHSYRSGMKKIRASRRLTRIGCLMWLSCKIVRYCWQRHAATFRAKIDFATAHSISRPRGCRMFM